MPSLWERLSNLGNNVINTGKQAFEKVKEKTKSVYETILNATAPAGSQRAKTLEKKRKVKAEKERRRQFQEALEQKEQEKKEMVEKFFLPLKQKQREEQKDSIEEFRRRLAQDKYDPISRAVNKNRRIDEIRESRKVLPRKTIVSFDGENYSIKSYNAVTDMYALFIPGFKMEFVVPRKDIGEKVDYEDPQKTKIISLGNNNIAQTLSFVNMLEFYEQWVSSTLKLRNKILDRTYEVNSFQTFVIARIVFSSSKQPSKEEMKRDFFDDKKYSTITLPFPHEIYQMNDEVYRFNAIKELFLTLRDQCYNTIAEMFSSSEDVVDNSIVVDVLSTMRSGGGCSKKEENMCHKTMFKTTFFPLFNLRDPVTKDNNCGFGCIREEIEETESFKAFNPLVVKERFNRYINFIREHNSIKFNSMVDPQTLVRLAYSLWDIRLRILNSTANIEADEDEIILLFMKNHYQRINPKKNEEEKKKEYAATNKEKRKEESKDKPKYEYCPLRINMKTQVRAENKDDQVLSYDIETYLENSICIPMAIGFCDNKHGYGYFTGKNCIDSFVEMMISSKYDHIKYVSGFNGSRFDHSFLLRSLGAMGDSWEKMKILRHAGSIISASLRGKKTIDLCKHFITSLEKLGENFQCSFKKSSIFHEDNKGWENNDEKYNSAMLEYLEVDVMLLKECSEKYNKVTLETYGVNWYDFISAPGMSFSLFKSYLASENPSFSSDKDFLACVEETRNNAKRMMEDKEFAKEYAKEEKAIHKIYGVSKSIEADIRSSIYGGRVEVFDNNHKFESNGDPEDYLVDIDGCALYGSSMALFPYPTSPPSRKKYSKTMRFDSINIEDITMGFYYCKVIIPETKNFVGVRPDRTKAGLRLVNISSKEFGWYNSVDIENFVNFRNAAIEYTEAILYSSTGFVFKKFIEYFVRLKNESKKQTPQYEFAKLMNNSLYGKMLQKTKRTEETIVSNENLDLDMVCSDSNHILKDIDIHSLLDHTIIKFEKKECDVPEIPIQLGSFILAYSRRIMHGVYEKCFPHCNGRETMYYSDTDSVVMHNNVFKKSGIKLSKELGGFAFDIEGKIRTGYFISKKLYYVEYEDSKGVMKEHIRGKGVRNSITVRGEKRKLLTKEVYLSLLEGKEVDIPDQPLWKRTGFQPYKKHFLETVDGKRKRMTDGEGKDLEIVVDFLSTAIFTNKKTLKGVAPRGVYQPERFKDKVLIEQQNG